MKWLNPLFALLMFNGILAYGYRHIRSTYRNMFPFLAAYWITGKYLLLYLLLSLIVKG